MALGELTSLIFLLIGDLCESAISRRGDLWLPSFEVVLGEASVFVCPWNKAAFDFDLGVSLLGVLFNFWDFFELESAEGRRKFESKRTIESYDLLVRRLNAVFRLL